MDINIHNYKKNLDIITNYIYNNSNLNKDLLEYELNNYNKINKFIKLLKLVYKSITIKKNSHIYFLSNKKGKYCLLVGRKHNNIIKIDKNQYSLLRNAGMFNTTIGGNINNNDTNPRKSAIRECLEECYQIKFNDLLDSNTIFTDEYIEKKFNLNNSNTNLVKILKNIKLDHINIIIDKNNNIFVNYYYIAILSYNNMKILCNDINNKIYNNKILNNIKCGDFNNNILTNMDRLETTLNSDRVEHKALPPSFKYRGHPAGAMCGTLSRPYNSLLTSQKIGDPTRLYYNNQSLNIINKSNVINYLNSVRQENNHLSFTKQSSSLINKSYYNINNSLFEIDKYKIFELNKLKNLCIDYNNNPIKYLDKIVNNFYIFFIKYIKKKKMLPKKTSGFIWKSGLDYKRFILNNYSNINKENKFLNNQKFNNNSKYKRQIRWRTESNTQLNTKYTKYLSNKFNGSISKSKSESESESESETQSNLLLNTKSVINKIWKRQSPHEYTRCPNPFISYYFPNNFKLKNIQIIPLKENDLIVIITKLLDKYKKYKLILNKKLNRNIITSSSDKLSDSTLLIDKLKKPKDVSYINSNDMLVESSLFNNKKYNILSYNNNKIYKPPNYKFIDIYNSYINVSKFPIKTSVSNTKYLNLDSSNIDNIKSIESSKHKRSKEYLSNPIKKLTTREQKKKYNKRVSYRKRNKYSNNLYKYIYNVNFFNNKIKYLYNIRQNIINWRLVRCYKSWSVIDLSIIESKLDNIYFRKLDVDIYLLKM